MKHNKGVQQALADNSTKENMAGGYSHGEDARKLKMQNMPNTRANDYMTNQFAGGGVHKTKAKVKGHTEHGKQEDELGDDYEM